MTDSLTPHSLSLFDTLHPSVKPLFEEFLNCIEGAGYNIQITSGYRTNQQQDELYAQGRTKSGKVITNAKGGQSMHNFGIAIDIVILDASGEYIWNIDLYKNLWHIAKLSKLDEKGLWWGGLWTSFKEGVHFDASGGKSLKEIIELYGEKK